MPISKDEQDAYLTIWAKTVDTQMHFNDMSVKSRQFGLAFVAAALGLGLVLMREKEFSVPVTLLGVGFNLHVTVLVVAASAFAMHAVRILDLNVYHMMLRGAVTFGEDFEQNYMKQIFDLEKGMTQAISHFSRHSDAGKETLPSGRYRYTGNDMKNAHTKIRRFYHFLIYSLLASALGLFVVTSHFHFEPASVVPTAPTVAPMGSTTPNG